MGPKPPTDSRQPAAGLVVGNKTFVLDRPEIAIGSAPDNDIVLAHPSVSAHHARIERSGDAYRLLDLQSDNGVRVNREDYYRVELLAGDEVEIGKVTLRFIRPGPPK